ncbi:MAG: LLM class flavin-dependent oxidoreductase [Acetobacteraceae bacterium]|nr:LLM class flavin-dependent oxidoreductase [Acetobacteraceae bacterium]
MTDQPTPTLSVLDLSPIPEGAGAGDALRNSLDLARHAEALGYRRYWMAEHHNMPGLACCATAVALAHIAAGTSTIRIGSGGIMLPNHAPLIVAEQFGSLAALHPGRIDLGLGRAPGTDQRTSWAIRRNMAGDVDDFPRDVMELMAYFRPEAAEGLVQATPATGQDVPVWILGSSTYGAQLAAHLGLPYGHASHFAPQQLMEAIAIYRERFRPSAQLDRPYVMVGANVTAAPTDEEARFLFSSAQQSTLNLRRGRPGRLPPPVENFEASLTPPERAVIHHTFARAIVGGPEQVRRAVAAFVAETGADELMATGNIFDHALRKRSFAILAEAVGTPARAAA